MDLVLFLGGLCLLIAGAETLVRGASRLAGAFGISPLVIGLTVVAFATGSPEIAIAVNATLAEQGGIALGNVIGSNIFNVLFILGSSAIVVPLLAARRLIRIDVPVMIAISAGVLVMSLDGETGRTDGALLLVVLVGYVIFSIRLSRSDEAAPAVSADEPIDRRKPRTMAVNALLVAAGLLLLVAGSNWLVEGTVSIARRIGISETIIALTIVAAATSLPEVVTSFVAAVRGERDMAVGNVVGSNIFNLTGVLGTAALVSPNGIEVSPAVLAFDLPIMLAVAFACLPVFFTGGTISRAEGTALLAYYAAYVTYLVLAATDHDALAPFSTTMMVFVVPITGLTLAIVAWRQFHR